VCVCALPLVISVLIKSGRLSGPLNVFITVKQDSIALISQSRVCGCKGLRLFFFGNILTNVVKHDFADIELSLLFNRVRVI